MLNNRGTILRPTHPNNNGYAIIAKGVAEMLVAVENGSYGE